MRIVFMGSPDFAVPTLNRLVADGHDIAAVYSQPPRPGGRGKSLQATPVHARAEALGLPVLTPARLRDPADQAVFAAHQADIAVVAAYGLILPREVLDAPRLGCVNVHASLLPRWRGAAPIHRAILAGDTTTGVTIMQMEAGLDTGPMLLTGHTRVDGKSSGILTTELAELGGELMMRFLADPEAFPPRSQPEVGVTYAAKIDKAESRIDWSRTAIEVERQVRAFAPVPGAWCEIGGERIRILSASISDGRGSSGALVDDGRAIACGDRAIEPLVVQRAGGRRPMPFADLLRGLKLPTGSRAA
jgi:methionyl-tRNA formyltransferase